MSTSLLLLLVAWTCLGYYLFPNPWAAFASFQGLFIAVLLWPLRGQRWKWRWWVVMIGIEEQLQVFVCQLAQNWWPREGPEGMCSAYTGWPLWWFGAWAFVLLALRAYGDNPDDRTKA